MIGDVKLCKMNGESMQSPNKDSGTVCVRVCACGVKESEQDQQKKTGHAHDSQPFILHYFCLTLSQFF